MHRTLPEDLPLDAPGAARRHLVASLVVDSATPGTAAATAHGMSSAKPKSRPLIHLARISGNGTNPGNMEPLYELGFPVSGSTAWHGVGHLESPAAAIERVLLAGVSVLAMKHVREAGVQIGDPVVVFGADAWSLLLLQWARLQGASPLVLVRRGSQSISESASSLGIDAILSDLTPGDCSQAIKLTYRAGGFAVALDAIATEQSVTQALSILRDGGRYVLAGLDPQRSIFFNAYPDLHRRDLEIVSPMHSDVEFDVPRMLHFSLDLAVQGRLHLNRLLDPASGWRVAPSTDTALSILAP